MDIGAGNATDFLNQLNVRQEELDEWAARTGFIKDIDPTE